MAAPVSLTGVSTLVAMLTMGSTFFASGVVSCPCPHAGINVRWIKVRRTAASTMRMTAPFLSKGGTACPGQVS